MWCKSFARTEQMHVDAKEKEKYGFNESYYICNAQFWQQAHAFWVSNVS